jgi:hypothetical protein
MRNRLQRVSIGLYIRHMSADEVLEKVKALPLRERRRVLRALEELGAAAAVRKNVRKSPPRWSDAEARRRKIFGDKVLPNLVLLAREEERR